MRKVNRKKIKLHIRTGDRVKVLAGKHKKEEGVILRVYPQVGRAIVEGVNIRVRHRKPSNSTPQGFIERREASIHISNLMLIDPVTVQPTRIGRKYDENGKLQRYAKKTGNFIRNG